MMFWGRSNSSTTTSATEHDPSSRPSSSNAAIVANIPVPVAPSYVLSEQRRNELLLAARSNRMSWVDNVDPQDPHSHRHCPLSTDQTTSILPSHCRAAFDNIQVEIATFWTQFDEFTHKLLPNRLHHFHQAFTAPRTTLESNKPYQTLFYELQAQKHELEHWQQSPPPRKTFSSCDHEMLFLSGFQQFLSILKNIQAAELVYRIQSFVKRAETWQLSIMLQARALQDRPGGRIQHFIHLLIQQIQQCPTLRALFQGNNVLTVEDSEGINLLEEVVEAFVLEKLYGTILSPSLESIQEDTSFYNRVKLLQFVTFQHLDVPVPITQEQERTWQGLIEQLQTMTRCPSPRRKMDRILRLCQDLTVFLKHQNHGRFPSADEFLPALILVVLRANPMELKRNVAFILEYRNPRKLVSEPGYFFTHLVSSIAFIEELNGSSLTISLDEFNKELQKSQAASGGVLTNMPRACNEEEEEKGTYKKDPWNGRKSHDVKVEQWPLPTVLEIRAKRLALQHS
ncbi:hypothetical protein CCR75_008184 [Bremia lactucae]|uniref:VPS9 domain-containing protein n=1 Tax=Bremia lactucae TaxID=4779 RepID=A0A976NZW0_BRELC|nr:hypothetical protein CCR75_008184 [Bremia lactucae]